MAGGAAGGVGGAARGGMNRIGIGALILLGTAEWLVFLALRCYWPTMGAWLAAVLIPASIVAFVWYFRSACELCGHTCIRHFMSVWLFRCTICGCLPGARDMFQRRLPRPAVATGPLLTRSDMIYVAIAGAGVGTPLIALTRNVSGWMLAIDTVLGALLGLLAAALIAAGIRLFYWLTGWPRP